MAICTQRLALACNPMMPSKLIERVASLPIIQFGYVEITKIFFAFQNFERVL